VPPSQTSSPRRQGPGEMCSIGCEGVRLGRPGRIECEQLVWRAWSGADVGEWQPADMGGWHILSRITD
jgi:hypothetical protein